MKLINIIFVLMLIGCAPAVAEQPDPATTPLSAQVTPEDGMSKGDLWGMVVEQAFIIEALKGELIAYQESGADYGYVYEVQAGQSLWIIADEVLGDPYRWITIFTLNYWMGDPDLIYPQQMLLLP